MAGAAGETIPLCVDLDGTLVRTDTLAEQALSLLGGRRLLACLWTLLTRGIAAFKQAVAASAPIDAGLLPYDPRVLEWLRTERRDGRRIVLVTAADRLVADAVSAHLGLFDEVMASDGTINLKGHAKAAAMVARFGVKGFLYAGDSRTDLSVWPDSAGAILVNASGGTERAARAIAPILHTFAPPPGQAAAMLTAMRPHQWVKNILVFVPILTAGAAGDLDAWYRGLLAFLAFCLTASGIYVLNDLMDLTADRRHARKRNRPFASGAVSPVKGVPIFAATIMAGAAAGLIAGILPVIAIYAALSISYSMRLKEMPLIDVFILAALYAIRMIGGGVATGFTVSLWLLAFSSFLFLSLALVKRVTELKASETRGIARRGYQAEDIVILQIMGCCAAFSSSVVMTLFVQSNAAIAHYASPALLWGLVPLFLFWQCRMWLSAARGWMLDDPIVFAFFDWVSWTVAASSIALTIVARFVNVTV